MRRQLLGLFTLVAMIGWAAPVFAARQSAAEVYKKLDSNGDGMLTVREYVGEQAGEKAEKAKERYAKMDKDMDGKLTLNEFAAAYKKDK